MALMNPPEPLAAECFIADYLQEYLSELYRILERRQLSAVFQPILDLRGQRYIAYEGLIRGPQDSPLHAPDYLFAAARHVGRTAQLELLAREIVIESYARLKLPAKLFINASVSSLHDSGLGASTLRHMERCGLHPSRVVIEITENQAVKDFSSLHDQLRHHRSLGFQFAMDDLGEGFSNLRMWSEVRPEFVKIDRHLISGIADDQMKFQLVRAMHEIAVTCRTTLIAEGIETEREFATIRDMGIDCGQGFLIERPAAMPQALPDRELLNHLHAGPLVIFPTHAGEYGHRTTIRQVLRNVEPISTQQNNDEVYRRFEAEPNLLALPVVDDGAPVGLINRHGLIDRFARPFRRELYGKKSCRLLMDESPLVVDQSISAQEVARLLGASSERSMQDGFIITDRGRYLGTGSTQSLMTLITDLQIRAARYANPLTQLPGNVPINEHIDRLLESGSSFVACYCDLDHFKPFNDQYGYRHGDQVIQQLGAVLARVVDPRLDFIGHIGGDDFIVLMQSDDWEQRMHKALELFARNLPSHLEESHMLAGGYIGEDRRGNPVFHPLPSVSIGCLPVTAGSFHSHHEVSAVVTDAKKQAKRTQGNSLFIDRRRYGTHAAIEEALA